MENLLDFVCRMESRLKSLGFEFEFQSPDSGSRYYSKQIRYCMFDGKYFDMKDSILRVRVSDHDLDVHDVYDNPNGKHHYQVIQQDTDENVEIFFRHISCYHWEKPQ
jgi:hypothetical protein